MIHKPNSIHSDFRHSNDCIEVKCTCGYEFIYCFGFDEYGVCDKCQARYNYTCYLERVEVDDPKAK